MAFAKRGAKVEFFDVKKDAAAMGRFLALSGGDRRVPLLEEDGQISIGYDGT